MPEPTKETIEVTRNEPGDYTVCLGDCYQEDLTTDEALYCVARWLIAPEKGSGYLRTKEEHEALGLKLAQGVTEKETDVNATE